MNAHIRVFQVFLGVALLMGGIWLAKTVDGDIISVVGLGLLAVAVLVPLYRGIKSLIGRAR